MDMYSVYLCEIVSLWVSYIDRVSYIDNRSREEMPYNIAYLLGTSDD